MAYLGNPAYTMAVLEKHGFHFQKKYGQNFLIDTHIQEKIIDAAEITKDDFVLEIGPGIGTMTQYLCEAAREVVAVEIDTNLLPVLDDTLKEYDNVTVLNEDILKVDIASLAGEKNSGKPIKVVANLPYYITTPIIMGLFETCFVPQPKVASSVIRLTCHEKPPVEITDEGFLFRVIRASFNQRRKTLANGLNNAPTIPVAKEDIIATIEELGYPASVRGETLSLEEFARLSEALKKKVH